MRLQFTIYCTRQPTCVLCGARELCCISALDPRTPCEFLCMRACVHVCGEGLFCVPVCVRVCVRVCIRAHNTKSVGSADQLGQSSNLTMCVWFSFQLNTTADGFRLLLLQICYALCLRFYVRQLKCVCVCVFALTGSGVATDWRRARTTAAWRSAVKCERARTPIAPAEGTELLRLVSKRVATTANVQPVRSRPHLSLSP